MGTSAHTPQRLLVLRQVEQSRLCERFHQHQCRSLSRSWSGKGLCEVHSLTCSASLFVRVQNLARVKSLEYLSQLVYVGNYLVRVTRWCALHCYCVAQVRARVRRMCTVWTVWRPSHVPEICRNSAGGSVILIFFCAFADFTALERVDDNLYIDTNPLLTTVVFPLLTYVGDYLDLTDNPLLTVIEFPKLRHAADNLYFYVRSRASCSAVRLMFVAEQANTLLSEVSGFPELEFIDGRMEFYVRAGRCVAFFRYIVVL